MAAISCMQTTVRPFGAAKASTRTASTRSCRLVVRAQNANKKDLVAAFRSADVSALVKPAAMTAIANVIMALPAHAEAGKIFDFNLTMPIMMGEFLFLMVFLDKFWFGPVGKVLDARDADLRGKLALVRDNSGDLGKLQAQAEAALAEARKEAQATIQAAKAEANAEAAKKLAAVKEKVDKELNTALAALETEKAAALQNLDSQVDKLSGEILARILPEGVKL